MVKECGTCYWWNGDVSTHKTAKCNEPEAEKNRQLGWLVPTKEPINWCNRWKSKTETVECGDGIQ